MQHVSSEELNRRIDTFISRKHQEYPELALRHKQPERKKFSTASEAFADLVAGFKWEFGR